MRNHARQCKSIVTRYKRDAQVDTVRKRDNNDQRRLIGRMMPPSQRSSVLLLSTRCTTGFTYPRSQKQSHLQVYFADYLVFLDVHDTAMYCAGLEFHIRPQLSCIAQLYLTLSDQCRYTHSESQQARNTNEQPTKHIKKPTTKRTNKQAHTMRNLGSRALRLGQLIAGQPFQ